MRQRIGRESRGYREARDEADTYGRRGYGAEWEEQDDEGRVARYDTRNPYNSGASEREREDVYPYGGSRYSESSRRYEPAGDENGGGGGWGWRSGPDSYTRPSMSRGGWGAREGWADESYPGERYGERSRQERSGSRGWRSAEDRYGYGSQSTGSWGSGSYGGGSDYGGGSYGYGRGMYGAGGSYTGESYRGSYSGGGTYGVGGLQSGSWGTSGGSGWNRPMSGSMERYGSEGMQGERSFRGRGPKGYTRSDERIREDVNDRLTDEDSIDAGEIEVSVESGEVTLAGSVPDREMKRRVEDLVESLSGVKNVQNNLRVKREVSLSERGSERGSERSNEYSSSTGSRSSSSSSATAGYGSKSNR